ncbi:unnamed protein product [Closterium sp. Naga37s-1]|nr:unnamed protein product [Closterium sp. Naga37s-1]
MGMAITHIHEPTPRPLCTVTAPPHPPPLPPPRTLPPHHRTYEHHIPTHPHRINRYSSHPRDMLVAALLDLGVPRTVVEGAVEAMGLSHVTCRVEATHRSAITAPLFSVDDGANQPYRDYAAIRHLLANSSLPRGARAIASRAFRLLAEAEACVHGMAVDDVHFHEVGAVDSIVDMLAAAAAIDYLAPSHIAASPLPMARGIIAGAAHGPLPSPAPATLEILCRSGSPCRHHPRLDPLFPSMYSFPSFYLLLLLPSHNGANFPTFAAGQKGELVTPT